MERYQDRYRPAKVCTKHWTNKQKDALRYVVDTEPDVLRVSSTVGFVKMDKRCPRTGQALYRLLNDTDDITNEGAH
jgi:hypothetical protein